MAQYISKQKVRLIEKHCPISYLGLTFHTILEYLKGSDLDLNTLTAKQIGQIIAICYAQHEAGFFHALEELDIEKQG